jgi:hypothetical protein
MGNERNAARLDWRPQLLPVIGRRIVAASGHDEQCSGDARRAVREANPFD